MPAPTHRLTGTPIYRSWQNMKARCDTKSFSEYFRYGARGISYDPKWSTFDAFYEDMGSSYKQGLSLDRVDNNGNYTKENCKWSTAKEQANNRRTSRFVTFEGKTMTLAQWADYKGIKPSTLRQRFYVYKWPFKRCIIN